MFRVVPDAGTRETMLLAGDVHMAMLPPAPDVRRLRENPNVTLVQAPTDRVIFIGLNTQWGPLRDARVRQAFNYAVNKGAILSSVLFDLGTVVDSPDRKSTRLNSSHTVISYAVFCLKKKTKKQRYYTT